MLIQSGALVLISRMGVPQAARNLKGTLRSGPDFLAIRLTLGIGVLTQVGRPGVYTVHTLNIHGIRVIVIIALAEAKLGGTLGDLPFY